VKGKTRLKRVAEQLPLARHTRIDSSARIQAEDLLVQAVAMNVLTREMRTVANLVRWFESTEEALRYPERFLAYLMTCGTLEAI
jgi:hypothetical protein